MVKRIPPPSPTAASNDENTEKHDKRIVQNAAMYEYVITDKY